MAYHMRIWSKTITKKNKKFKLISFSIVFFILINNKNIKIKINFYKFLSIKSIKIIRNFFKIIRVLLLF